MFTYVYFLFLKNGQIYTGLTTRLQERTRKHKRGKVRSTRHRRPIQLIGYEAYRNEYDARRREHFLKTTQGKRLFRQQYRDILEELRNNGA